MKYPFMGYLNKADILFIKLRIERFMYWKKSVILEGVGILGIIWLEVQLDNVQIIGKTFSDSEFQREKLCYKKVKS